jgi:hypothetical protein
MPVRPSDHGIVSASGAGGAVVLSGGTAFTYGGADFMKFTASGTLTVAGSGVVDYIVVGGGGAGGYNGNYSAGSGGGGGPGGIAWGVNYQLDAGVKTTFAVTVGAAGAGGSGNNGGQGGNSLIADWGGANGSSNFDWAGGSSYATTLDDLGVGGGGGGGKGDAYIYIAGALGTMGNAVVSSGSDDWASGGSGAGGGGWDGYASGPGNYGGNSWVNSASDEDINTITNENNDSSVGTHYVSGRNGPPSQTGTNGNAGRATITGTAASFAFPGSLGNSGDVSSTNRGFEWLDGVRYGTPGAGGRGSWYDSADGGGQGSNQGGPLDALDNQGGGGAGAGAQPGGEGGSGIVIFRIVPA